MLFRSIADFVEHVGRDKVLEYIDSVNDMHFRWGLFWAGCRARPGGLSFDLYADGINDTHVDTVLRKVMVELNLTKKEVVSC